MGGVASYVHADVSREADARAMVRHAVETYGGLNVLYNNAGVMLGDGGSVDATDQRIWDTTLAVNVKGVAFGCKYGFPAMIEAGGGSVINVASFVAWMGAATSQTAYTASKGAVLWDVTREIAVEYARRGIRVNALCPGPIETPLLMQLLSDPQKRQRRMVHIPMGRLGQAEELARAALFLASEDSSFMTGASLTVDGGITAAYVTPGRRDKPLRRSAKATDTRDMDVRSFLQGSPPFDALDEDVLDRVVAATEIEFVPEGDVLFRQGGGPVDAVYVTPRNILPPDPRVGYSEGGARASSASSRIRVVAAVTGATEPRRIPATPMISPPASTPGAATRRGLLQIGSLI